MLPIPHHRRPEPEAGDVDVANGPRRILLLLAGSMQQGGAFSRFSTADIPRTCTCRFRRPCLWNLETLPHVYGRRPQGGVRHERLQATERGFFCRVGVFRWGCSRGNLLRGGCCSGLAGLSRTPCDVQACGVRDEGEQPLGVCTRSGRERWVVRPAYMFAGGVMGWEQRSDGHCRALTPPAYGNMSERYSKLVLVDTLQINCFVIRFRTVQRCEQNLTLASATCR